jgi:hypothetical protein
MFLLQFLAIPTVMNQKLICRFLKRMLVACLKLVIGIIVTQHLSELLFGQHSGFISEAS